MNVAGSVAYASSICFGRYTTFAEKLEVRVLNGCDCTNLITPWVANVS